MMLKPYTVQEISDIIQTAIDSAGDDKGHGVQGALDDLQVLVSDLDQHKDTTLELIKSKEELAKLAPSSGTWKKI